MNAYPAGDDKVAGLEDYVGYGYKANNTQRHTRTYRHHKDKYTHIYMSSLKLREKTCPDGLFWLQLKINQREVYWKNIDILNTLNCKQSSVQFSCSVMSNSLRPHELQQARPPCPTPTPRAHPNSCPLSRWCHPTISSSVIPFSSCPQSFPASGSFPMSQLFVSDGQSTGVSASTSDLPMNTQDWSPLGWTGWISLQSKQLSRVFSNTTVQKHQFFGAQLSL